MPRLPRLRTATAAALLLPLLPVLGGAADAGPSVDPLAALAGVDLDAVVETAPAEDGQLRTVGCRAPLHPDPVLGCVTHLDDGMVAYVGPDGAVGTTHGGDHAGHGTEAAGEQAPAEVAASGSRSLPSSRRPLVCAAEGEPRAVVLYGHRRGQDRRSQHLATIRETLERSNQAVALSAQRSGGPTADLRVACTRDGNIAVRSVEIGSTRFSDLRATLAAAGYDRREEKYLLFADVASPDPNVAGTADLFVDDRRSVDNRNNGRAAMYAVVYDARHFTGTTALHELAHTMGAVQPGAPRADGGGHCTDNLDVLCYPNSSTRCGTIAFDCGNDTYFSTSTTSGEWLHTRWNLGWEGNRFIELSAARTRSSRTGFRDVAGHPHEAAIAAAVEAGITTGYSDGTYRPGAPVTRAQMATFLTRALDLPAGDASRFRDVGRSTHAAGIGAVARASITEGYPDRTFRPNDPVTRGQMASFLARGFELSGGGAHGFRDVRGSAHERSITAVAGAGVANGYDDGTFRPGAAVTRGQMAAFLVRALDTAS